MPGIFLSTVLSCAYDSLMIKPGIFSLYYTDDEKYILLPFFWLPEDTLELRCRRDHVLYDVWQKRGIHPDVGGNVIHYGFIEKFIERLGETYHIREIAYDRWTLP